MRPCKYEAGVKCTIIHERWKLKLHFLHQNIIGFCYKLHYKWIGTFETAKKWNHFMFCKNIETILFPCWKQGNLETDGSSGRIKKY